MLVNYIARLGIDYIANLTLASTHALPQPSQDNLCLNIFSDYFVLIKQSTGHVQVKMML